MCVCVCVCPAVRSLESACVWFVMRVSACNFENFENAQVVNNLENYIMNQVHSDAARDLEQGLKNALDLDDIAALHTKFLHRMRDRCMRP